MKNVNKTVEVTVVGVEHGGFVVPSSRRALEEADVVVGWPRHLKQIALPEEKSTHRVETPEDCITVLEEYDPERRVVLLASGDPLFYGIGRYLNRRLPSDRLRYIPARSSVQLAFAALKTDYNQARIHSLHGRPLESLRTPLAETPSRMALFTEPVGNTPEAIFEFLDSIGCVSYRFFLCEALSPEGPEPREIDQRSDFPDEIDPLNLVVLLRRSDIPAPERPRPGVSNRFFTGTDDSMVSVRELRWIDLGLLGIGSDEVVWEIGAATGSISLESARLNPRARYHAVEQRPDRFETLRSNIRELETFNVIPHEGRASEWMPKLPNPDRIFLGGSGSELKTILERADERLRPGGVVVANFITLENAEKSRRFFRQRDYDWSLTQLGIHRAGRIGSDYTRWEPGPSLNVLRAAKQP